MKNLNYTIILLSFSLLFINSLAAENTFLLPACSTLFSNNDGLVSQALQNATTYNGILSTSLLIVTMVMTTLGLVYGIGYAFRIDKLMKFVQTEIVESLFNIVLIVVLAAGPAIFDSSIAFVVNLGTIGQPTVQITSAQSLYISICNNFEGFGMNAFLDWVGVFKSLFVQQALTSLVIAIMPGGEGIVLTPFWGLKGLIQILWLEQTIFMTTMEFDSFLVFVLFILYFLFPAFLYIGIALRSFPWTRAAGGSFIAMFIAFYVVFPALVYPFTTGSTSVKTYQCSGSQNSLNCNINSYNIQCSFASGTWTCIDDAKSKYTCIGQGNNFECGTTQGNLEFAADPSGNGGTVSVSNPLCSKQQGSSVDLCTPDNFLIGTGNFWDSVGGTLSTLGTTLTFQFGDLMYNNVQDFTRAVWFIGAQLIGVLFAFIISFDLLESLGDMLGAPSLQSKSILSKIL